MNFKQTLLLTCLFLVISSFSVHASLFRIRRFIDVTPYTEDTIDVSSSKYAPTHIFSSQPPAPAPAPAPAPTLTEEEVSGEKDEGKTSPPPHKISTKMPSATITRQEETNDSIVTSGLSNSDAGDKILSTATDNAVNEVRDTAAAAGARSVDPKVLKFCAITKKPNVCINSILPFIRSTSANQVDPMTILENEMKASIKEAKKTINKLSVVAGNPNIVDQMETCKESYKNALDNFNEALKVVPERDLARITTVLSAAMTDLSTCDEAFSENPSMHSPLAPQLAARLKDLTDISMEIANKWVPEH